MINTISTYFKRINNAIILFGGLFILSCGEDNKQLPQYNSEIDLTKDMAYNVTIILSQKAKTQTKITSPLLVRNENIIPSFAEMPEGLEAEFFNDSGVVSTRLTSDYARYYEREQNVILQRNVVVINADSTVLRTEELIWNNIMEKFYTDKPVEITRKNQIITGTGLEADKDLTEVKILHQKSVIPIDDLKHSSTTLSTQDSSSTPQKPVDSLRKDRPQTRQLSI